MSQKITSFTVVRPEATLSQNPNFVQPKGVRGKGFEYFFMNRMSAKRPFWGMASLVASYLADESLPFAGVTKQLQKAYARQVVGDFQKSWKALAMSELVNVRKNAADSNFDIVVPILAINGNESAARNLLLYAGLDPATEDVRARLEPGVVNIADMKLRGNISQKDVAEWAAADAKLICRVISGYLVFMIHYKANRGQIQQLVNEEFQFIRPMDVYGPVYEWTSSYFGQQGRSPAFSMPLRQIARSVKAAAEGLEVPVRTSEANLLTDEHGDLFWIPTELDDIKRFEDTYSAAYNHEDSGVFGVADMMTEGKPTERRKPPTPMPVYVDWVNLKFSYTNQRGRLEVKSLDRSYPATPTHLIRFMNRRVESEKTKTFLQEVFSLGVFYNMPNRGFQPFFAEASRFLAQNEGIEVQNLRLSDLMGTAVEGVYAETLPEGVDFFNMCKGILRRIEDSPELAYARYSVTTILSIRGALRAMVDNWKNLAALESKDREARNSYLNQKVDPNYALPEIPFIAANRGLLPHQGKTLNLSKDSPANVLYPVEAGGGKTMIYITDLLREMGHFKTPGPYIIMCPSHLVAQYVKEIVYATDGRVNAIAISSYTVRRQGLDRLKTLIMASPVNTVLIVDYNVVTLRNRAIAYGPDTIRVFPIVEFVRQFAAQVVYSDETHYLKSESTRQQAVHRLISDIPKRRGASGTFAPDTIKDLVKQASLFDPSIFGTMQDFINEFALEVRGTKVLQWKPGTEARVKQIMKDNFIYAEARRKEWAAILPSPKEAFWRVDLSDNQMKVYRQILDQVVETIMAEMEKNQALRDLLSKSNSEDGDSDDEVEDSGISLDSLLKPYLARLERFITAPGKDPLGATMLTGDDLISPKVRKIIELTMKHIEDQIPGKVLIFTNYNLSAEAIYEAFPESFRDSVVFYTAANKEACGAEFEKNDSKLVMVGVEQSMNTGLNLQFASRLIRCETVWVPGTLEQGNARIGRPNIKGGEDRPFIYYDWIVGNNTIDVTKVSYLMAKTISVAKYTEAGNSRFDDLEVPPLFPMTLDMIQANNDFDTTLVDYFQKYEAYKLAVADEYAEYREKNRDILFNKDGTLKMVKLVRGPNLEGSKLLRRVPYVPGTELYKAEDLGLIRYDAYMRLEEESLEEGEDGDDEVEETNEDEDEGSPNDSLAAERQLAMGLAVHTDRGDGEITRVGKKRVGVLLPSGERFSFNKLSVFIITRKDTSNKDIRTNLLKMVGDVPLDAPIDVLEPQTTDSMAKKMERMKMREERLKNRQRPAEEEGDEDVPQYRIKPGMGEDEDGNEVRLFNVIDSNGDIVDAFTTRREARQWIERALSGEEEEDTPTGPVLTLSFTVVNDILGIRLENADDERAVDIAQQYGFKFSPEYLAAEIPTPRHMLKLFQGWKEAGFAISKENNAVCKQLYERMLKTGRKALPSTFGFASALELKNFYTTEYRPNPKDDLIMPYPLVQDGALYMALPSRAHPASIKAVRTVKVPGVKWMKFEANTELILFTRTKEKTNEVIRKMLSEGVKFSNLAELKKEFRALRVVRD